MRKSTSGFTIVELLVVIVIIATLAAISLVAFNGVQQRARDSQRKSDIATMQKVLAIYYGDKNGYPACNGGVFTGGTGQTCTLSDPDVVAQLVPTYMSKSLVDPKNTAQYQYYYAVGWKVGTVSNPACGVGGAGSNNYVLAVGLENAPIVCGPNGWFGRSDFGIVVGSTN